MSAAFTPGPWQHFVRRNDNHGGFFIDAALGNSANNFTVIADAICGQHAEANARLIAAAPELYESLAFLLHCPEVDEPEARALAEAALAKARGDQ